MSVPIVVLDEAGHTGENLLDAAQPVYSLAAVRLERSVAEQAVSAALARSANTTTEIKFSRLKKSNVGRKNLLTLLDDIDIRSLDAAVVVLHKPWMVAAKMVDELIEPKMLAKGISGAWYASGAATNMATAFYELAPRALGEHYVELAQAFVSMVRDYTPEAAATYTQALQRAKIACLDDQVHDLLTVMIDTPKELEEEFAGREDALDPALTALFWQAGHWSEELQTRFEFLHDDSKEVRRWQEDYFAEMQSRMAGSTTAESFEVGDITIRLPSLLDTISFETSHGDARVQVADVLAGAAAHIFSVATEGARDEGDLARHLADAGVVETIKHAVGPELNSGQRWRDVSRRQDHQSCARSARESP